MSFCYSFPKSSIPFENWLGKIEDVIREGEDGEVVEGKWREMLLSNMLRMSNEGEEGSYGEKFLTEGSIRGVLVSEEGDDIEIKLHTFASRSDQYLAARMAWEAIAMGATVEKEGYGPIAAEDLGGEAVEATHAEWFGMSMRMLGSMGDGGQLPIFGFLSLKIEPGDRAKDAATLERDLIARLAGFGDAFLSTQMVLGIDGVGEKTVGILQPNLHTLVTKDADGVATNGSIIPMDGLVEVLGDRALDGGGCWVLPPASSLDPATLQALAGKSFGNGGGTASGEPSDGEWMEIAKAPILAFLMVAAADGKVDKKELEGFGKVITGLAAQQKHKAVARMMQTAFGNIETMVPALISDMGNAVATFESVTKLIDSRFGKEDAMMIKSSVLFLAREIAESSGGFLGFGPKISKDEKMALVAIMSLLGLVGE